MAILADVTDPR